MALTVHDIGAIVVSGSSAFNLDGMTDLQIDPGNTLVVENAGGQYDPSFAAVSQTMPMATASVTDIATAIANIALAGFAFPQTTVYTTVDVFFTQMAESGLRTSSTTHTRCRMAKGLVVPRSLTASQGGVASLGIEIHALYDGSNVPMVFADNIALPHTPTIGELFTLGKVMINGTQLDGVQSWTFDFGLTVEKVLANGELYPTGAYITRRAPKFEIRTKKVPSLTTFGLNGTAQGSTDSVIYLQKLEKNANILATATEEHISFTIDDGMVTVGQTGGSNNATGESVVTITPTWDGTNAIVVIDETSAIS